ncbi:putative pectinesterase (PE) [Phytophthora infestans]|uniref:Putative pectinesterase (PE) n=1 Tax=Phytophthora infestans TaxID=4787 RepID=A0A833SFR8_PHYIN|nr:putative pectinesterase (PE) [Phytophthora infestans]
MYSGSYKTVAEGVTHIPNTTDEHTLFVFPGVYHEQVVVPKLNGPLVLQGYTCDTMSYAANEVTITGEVHPNKTGFQSGSTRS